MYDGPERRQLNLSEELIEAIADRAAEKALEKVYTAVGKSVVKKALWVIGVISLVAATWLTGHGFLNK